MKKFTYLLLALTMAFTVSCGSTSGDVSTPDITTEDVQSSDYTTIESPNGYSFDYSNDWYSFDLNDFSITIPDGTVIDATQFESEYGVDPSLFALMANGVDSLFFSLGEDGSFAGTTNIIYQPNTEGVNAEYLQDPDVAKLLEETAVYGLSLSGINLSISKPLEVSTIGNVTYAIIEGTADEAGNYLLAIGVDDKNMYTITSLYSDVDPDYREKVENLLSSVSAQ